MSDPTTQTPTEATEIAFTNAHVPSLEAGKYELTVDQNLQATGIASKGYDFKTARIKFYVQGERFHLGPQEVNSVFPPAGGLGDYSNVLPHIAISRSTLPWERVPQKGKKDQANNPLPWLALLVLRDEELHPQDPGYPELQSQAATGFVAGLDRIQQLGDAAEAGVKPLTWVKTPAGSWQIGDQGSNLPFISKQVLPGLDIDLTEEIGHDPKDRVNLIFVKQALVKLLVPQTAEELRYRAHTRHDIGSSGVDNEKAVIIANRLPEAGKSSVVHLVSLEHRYGEDGAFDFGSAGAGEDVLVPFISLKSWRFTCLGSEHTFDGRMRALGSQKETTLRIPATAHKVTDKYLQQGFAPVPHYFREGSQSVSWYRGPLAIGAMPVATAAPYSPLAGAMYASATKPDLPLAKSGDQLLQFYPEVGFFDVSYAAAWELGRLLSLRNQGFSLELSRWKKSFRRGQKMAGQESDYTHLPAAGPGDTPDPSGITKWLQALIQLSGVPFNYLVPDERMLPSESLRFFHINPNWMASLLDGALSIGGKLPGTGLEKLLSGVAYYQTGFLLRSSVVSGFPGLHIETSAGEAPAVRQLLGPNVLLCLFEGDPQQVDFFINAEVLHFGFDWDAGSKTYKKKLRNAEGNEVDLKPDFTVPFVSATPDLRIVDFEKIREWFTQKVGDEQELVGQKLEFFSDDSGGQAITPAQLALSLIEGTSKFQFQRASSSPLPSTGTKSAKAPS